MPNNPITASNGALTTLSGIYQAHQLLRENSHQSGKCSISTQTSRQVSMDVKCLRTVSDGVLYLNPDLLTSFNGTAALSFVGE